MMDDQNIYRALTEIVIELKKMNEINADVDKLQSQIDENRMFIDEIRELVVPEIN